MDLVSEAYPNCEDGEVGLVKQFLQASCGCKMGKDSKPCTSTLTFCEVFEYRANCASELDMVILGKLNAHYAAGSSVAGTSSRSTNAAATYFHKNNQHCRKCFLFLHTITDKRFRNLVDHCRMYGVTPRTHGHTGKSRPITTSPARISSMFQLVKNLASSVSLPHRTLHLTIIF